MTAYVAQIKNKCNIESYCILQMQTEMNETHLSANILSPEGLLLCFLCHLMKSSLQTMVSKNWCQVSTLCNNLF